MISAFQIQNMRREAALRAKRAKRQPFVPVDAAMAENPQHYGRGIPNFGDYRPVGWKLREYHMVDSSGFGGEDEPAWTQRRLQRYMVEHLGEKLGYAVIEAGEFQVVVGIFERLEGAPEPKTPRKKKGALQPIPASFSVSMGKVPSDDPLAFVYGFTNGYAGHERERGRDLAPAYKEGFALGRDVRLGKRPMPEFAVPQQPTTPGVSFSAGR